MEDRITEAAKRLGVGGIAEYLRELHRRHAGAAETP
jgi:hypothetical protein